MQISVVWWMKYRRMSWFGKALRYVYVHFIHINFFEQFKSLLPEPHKNLSDFVDCLPGNEHPMAHPFSGFVLNVNVLSHCWQGAIRTGIIKTFVLLFLFLTVKVGNLSLWNLALALTWKMEIWSSSVLVNLVISTSTTEEVCFFSFPFRSLWR